MAQIERKWISDQAVNNEKIDPTDTYHVDGLVVDSTSALGSIGIGTNDPQDALHVRRSASTADLRLDSDGGSGQTFQLNSDTAGRFNLRDIDNAADRISVINTGNVGIATNVPLTQLHVKSVSPDLGLTLDLEDGLSGRAYQLFSRTTGHFEIYDLNAAATRLDISDIGTVTITGDATIDGNFQVDGTVTVINTEIIITDQLEINQTANQAALIASQDAFNSATVVRIENEGSGAALTTFSPLSGDGTTSVGIGTLVPQAELHVLNQNAANSSVVVSVENVGSGPALTTTGSGGKSIGIGTAVPLAELHVEGDILGKVTASASNIGSSSRRIGTIYMASDINHLGNLNFNGTNVTFDSTAGRVGIGSAIPAQPLDVVGNITSSTTMTAGTGITATTGNIAASAGAVNAGTTMTAGTGITATTGNIVASAGSVNANTSLSAGTTLSATGASTLTGNVGIGGTAPASVANYKKLHVISGAVTSMIECDSGGTPEVKLGSFSNHEVTIYTNNTTARLTALISGGIYGEFIDIFGGVFVNGNMRLSGTLHTSTTTQLQGNVGIGTAPSTDPLLVGGTVAIVHTVPTLGFVSTTTKGQMWVAGTDFNISATTGNTLSLLSGGSDALKFTAAQVAQFYGNVGIGTAPSVALHIYSAVASSGRLRIEEGATGGNNTPGLMLYNENVYQGGLFYDESGDEVWLSFRGGNGVVIDSATGNVGVKKSPTVALDVLGAALISSNLGVTGTLSSGAISGTGTFHVPSIQTGVSGFYMELGDATYADVQTRDIYPQANDSYDCGGSARRWSNVYSVLGNFTGLLTKSGGGFLIDHPQDPLNKTLYHSFVESPEMRNMYCGQAATVEGKIVITLPHWWASLNGEDKSEFTYQFTTIGSYSRLYVSKEIEDNKFEVTSLDGDCKFSWIITSIRHDAYAEDNPQKIEENKVGDKKGKLIYERK